MPAVGGDRVYGRYDPKALGAPLLSSPAHAPQVHVRPNLPPEYKKIPTEALHGPVLPSEATLVTCFMKCIIQTFPIL
jgi:hypothetical protein